MRSCSVVPSLIICEMLIALLPKRGVVRVPKSSPKLMIDDADDGRWWARRQGARAPPYLPAVRYGPILSPYYYVTNK